ncbi:Uncharacterised protein at_DN2511, partial [Pycnogonum litorale]
ERVSSLFTPEYMEQIPVFPHRDFEILCNLNCDNLLADFNEDIEKEIEKEQEKILKQQFVQYATRKLVFVIDITSDNCSLQVQ